MRTVAVLAVLLTLIFVVSGLTRSGSSRSSSSSSSSSRRTPASSPRRTSSSSSSSSHTSRPSTSSRSSSSGSSRSSSTTRPSSSRSNTYAPHSKHVVPVNGYKTPVAAVVPVSSSSGSSRSSSSRSNTYAPHSKHVVPVHGYKTPVAAVVPVSSSSTSSSKSSSKKTTSKSSPAGTHVAPINGYKTPVAAVVPVSANAATMAPKTTGKNYKILPNGKIKIDYPKLLKVPAVAGQANLKIDHVFIAKAEGYTLQMYVPQKKDGTVIGKSGPTIVNGLDLGQRDHLNDLMAQGLSANLANKLTPYLHKQKDAVSYVAAHPLTLTAAEGNELVNAVAKTYDQNAANTYNRLRGPVQFQNLPANAQTVIASVSHQYGSIGSGATTQFASAIKNRNYSQAAAALRDMGKGTSYADRRNAEAKLLESIN